MSIEVGSVVEGVVTGITNFGAFVELPEGKVGLVHISEVADVYVKDVHDFLKERDQ
ncbi:MAG: S1 RNA-binding domain-containing protein, partial [Selenomonadaceae bacterium]|nr:S1 RNA-binding domain-containing protein [Selenomonadaceae bacterium]